MTKTISSKLEQIDSFEQTFKDLSKQMMAPGQDLFSVDMLAIGVINRSLSLLSGFTTLIRSKNYIAASHLVRPLLDNYLRFHATWLVNEPHEFAMEVMKGIHIDQLQDRKGKKMHDSYLVKIASIEYPWIQNVYKETSGFIHLSKKHVFTSTILKNKEKRTIEFRVSKEDKYVTDEAILEAVECVIEITNCIIALIEGWIWSKSNPEKLAALKE